jgi:hypothetical protein
MAEVFADKDKIIELVDKVMPSLQYFAATTSSYEYADFDIRELSDIALLRDTLRCYSNKDEIKDLLNKPVHESSLKGLFFWGLGKVGLTGLSNNLEFVLHKFNKMVLIDFEPLKEYIPQGFEVRTTTKELNLNQVKEVKSKKRIYIDEFGEGVGLLKVKSKKRSQRPRLQKYLQRL